MSDMGLYFPVKYVSRNYQPSIIWQIWDPNFETAVVRAGGRGDAQRRLMRAGNFICASNKTGGQRGGCQQKEGTFWECDG